MSERTTGATPEQIEAAAKRHYDSHPRAMKWGERTPEYRTQWMRTHRLHAAHLVQTDERIVKAADLRAVMALADAFINGHGGDDEDDDEQDRMARLREVLGDA